MSKKKLSGTSHYELFYLIPNKFTDNEVRPISEKINNEIKKRGGDITLAEEWGKKRLAYPVRSFGYGYYFLVEFNSEGKNISEIDRSLRMMSEILRHQIVAKEIKTAEEIAREKEIAKKIAAPAPAKEEEKEKKAVVVDLKDLDEKLDKILETDDLL